MHLKTFQAETMKAGLDLVKAEFGPDAMIVTANERVIKKWFGLVRRNVVEITVAAPPPSVGRNGYLSMMHEARANREKAEPTMQEEMLNTMIAPLARQVRQLKDIVESMNTRPPVSTRTMEAPETQPESEVNSEVPAPAGFNKHELNELKKHLLAEIHKEKESLTVQASFSKHAGHGLQLEADIKDNVRPVVEALRSHCIDEEVIERIITDLEPITSRTSSLPEIEKHARIALARLIKCAPPSKIKKGNGKPRVIALVGPTGVGKTTTTAKIAAMYATKKEASIAFIASDVFRVGAVDQLKTYSNILKSPLEVAANSDDMKTAIDKHQNKDLIIIDTIGSSPNDLEKLTELKALLHSDTVFEIHLCLSASTKDAEINRIITRFNMLPITRMIFTKLDEAETFGCIVNAHVKHRLQLSYFTNGQTVPDNIETASAKKIVDLVMSGLKTEEAVSDSRKVV